VIESRRQREKTPGKAGKPFPVLSLSASCSQADYVCVYFLWQCKRFRAEAREREKTRKRLCMCVYPQKKTQTRMHEHMYT